MAIGTIKVFVYGLFQRVFAFDVFVAIDAYFIGNLL